MKIGFNATAAFKLNRTGVEEYVYRLLEALTLLPEAKKHDFILYKDVRDRGRLDFPLPNNFKIKELHWPLAWTQIRLSAEMFFHRPDVLFVPVHVLPCWAPPNSVVTIHGLEYEYFPKDYSRCFRKYLRANTRSAARRAQKIIAVSEATKKDLVRFYGVEETKITVIHHGVFKSKLGDDLKKDSKEPYLLFLGRIELKKNILNILEAFRVLKEKYKIPHRLVLAGSRGYGYQKIRFKIENLKLKIEELGFVSEKRKWELLKNADIFLFTSRYEGFGLPILEAQSVGTPVVASNISAMPEIAGQGAQLVNPASPEEIARRIYRIVSDANYQKLLVARGFDNIKRFSWEKCARETLNVLINP